MSIPRVRCAQPGCLASVGHTEGIDAAKKYAQHFGWQRMGRVWFCLEHKAEAVKDRRMVKHQ
jgi:hypothetical protein